MLAINLYIPCNFTLKKGRKLLYFLCLQNLLVFFFIFSLAVSMSLILEEKIVKSWRIILRKYLKDNICIRLNFFSSLYFLPTYWCPYWTIVADLVWIFVRKSLGQKEAKILVWIFVRKYILESDSQEAIRCAVNGDFCYHPHTHVSIGEALFGSF
jgi:hypothetical protein